MALLEKVCCNGFVAMPLASPVRLCLQAKLSSSLGWQLYIKILAPCQGLPSQWKYNISCKNCSRQLPGNNKVIWRGNWRSSSKRHRNIYWNKCLLLSYETHNQKWFVMCIYMQICMVLKIISIIQCFDYCLLQKITVSHLKFLFTIYEKLLTISYYIYYITLEKYFTVHLITQVKNK